MRSPSVRRLAGWFTRSFCLLLPLLAGCGDYCLFCDGQGGGGGGGKGSTAKAGDMILADQFASSISIYPYSENTQETLLSGYSDVSGLALYSSEAEGVCDNPFSGLLAYGEIGASLYVMDTFSQQDGEPYRLSLAVVPKGMTFPYGTNSSTDQATTELLFFTVNTEDTLYVYDLLDANVPQGFSNPYAITNDEVGTDFFQSPTALAVDVDGNKATLFVLNDDGTNSSVKRLSVNLGTWVVSSPQTIATMGKSDTTLVDITLYNQGETKALFISKKLTQGVGGWVYRITNPTTTSAMVNLDTAQAFIQREQRITGLAVPSTNEDETAAALLLVKENIAQGQVEQYDPEVGGQTPDENYTPTEDFDFLQAIRYDCTNRRLLMTDVPGNHTLDRYLLEAFPAR